MELSEEIGDYSNATIGGIWSAFSWDRRDIEADDLPMMNSVAWPLGEMLNLNSPLNQPYPDRGSKQSCLLQSRLLQFNVTRAGGLLL